MLDHDLAANTITVTTDSFSLFAVGEIPEPATIALLIMGGLGMFIRPWLG